MNYSKTLPVTGAAYLAATGYWIALGLFITSVFLLALIINKTSRIK